MVLFRLDLMKFLIVKIEKWQPEWSFFDRILWNFSAGMAIFRSDLMDFLRWKNASRNGPFLIVFCVCFVFCSEDLCFVFCSEDLWAMHWRRHCTRAMHWRRHCTRKKNLYNYIPVWIILKLYNYIPVWIILKL